MATISPTQANIQGALIAFLTNVLPSGTPIKTGQYNRAPQPQPQAYAIITPLRFPRLATNVDTFNDVKFVGGIAGNVLNVSSIAYGELAVGSVIFGTGVAANTTITALGTGTGGVGTYTVNPSQMVGGEVMAAGTQTLEQDMDAVVQLDFYSTDYTAGDMAQIVSTSFRDEFGVDFFAALPAPLNGVVPLHADDPKQTPLIDEEVQYEWRWTIEAHMEVNQFVSFPLQFFDSATVTAIDVSTISGP